MSAKKQVGACRNLCICPLKQLAAIYGTKFQRNRSRGDRDHRRRSRDLERERLSLNLQASQIIALGDFNFR